MTRYFLLLLILSAIACGGPRRPSVTAPPEQIAIYGRLATHRHNQRQARIQKRINDYNSVLKEFNRLMTTLDLKQDHTAELLALRKEILQILDELQELYEDSIDDLEQIEETLHLY